MRELRILRKQVQAMWKIEEGLSPNEREHHQWQVLAMQGGVPYIVGKGGANTFFYKVGATEEMQYALPDKMFAIIDGWLREPYVLYAITSSRDFSDAPQSTSLEKLKGKTKDRYVGMYLVGVTSDNRVIRLFKLDKGLRSNQWIPFGQKKRKKS